MHASADVAGYCYIRFKGGLSDCISQCFIYSPTHSQVDWFDCWGRVPFKNANLRSAHLSSNFSPPLHAVRGSCEEILRDIFFAGKGDIYLLCNVYDRSQS